jgi:leucyl/phenylalanyl-tRNA--protein transferase
MKIRPSNYIFPNPASAPKRSPLAQDGDLEPGTILAAYQNGIFPWSTSPITWWSPDPRGIIPLENFHISRRLKQTIRNSKLAISRNHAFNQVIDGCAEPTPKRPETWLSPTLQSAYRCLHQAGFAHSVEVWDNQNLVGGIFGLSIGAAFAAESMFSRIPNGSKLALTHLVQYLQSSGCRLLDVQVTSPHTESLGAINIPRDTYLLLLTELRDQPIHFDPMPPTPIQATINLTN